MDLLLRHRTEYTYTGPVSFGPHRLMLRPRDSFDMRILNATLTTSPPATLNWMHDAYGNPVAVAEFEGESDQLVIESELTLRRYGSSLPTPNVNPRWAAMRRVEYSEPERIVLAPFIHPAEEGAEQMLGWAQATMAMPGNDHPHPLATLSQAIKNAFSYAVRHEEGVQSPAETLAKGSGSCRDLAWLFIEVVRNLGYAARFVSGYLHDASAGGDGLQAPVSLTHAWAEVFIPGDGWIEFDPTNALVADPQLIRVAVARTAPEVSPVSGSFTGAAGLSALSVAVHITPQPPAEGAGTADGPVLGQAA